MTSKKSEWNLTINEKNRFSYLDPNGLFVICKYCERFGNSVNQDVGRINMRRPFIVLTPTNGQIMLPQECTV